jgi:Ca-activated chloride channel family protein
MKKRLLKLMVILTLFTTNIIAQDKPQAVIIFDASGSMWGQIDGKAKITIAKDALNSVVKEWNPDVELGLTAYGHRKKGDCNDIEALVPVGAIDKDKIISLVKKIQPKGKTPIARSLKKVAQELKFTEEKATIILISDGKESCDANPCDVAKELEKKGIDFVTHVIGFNVDKKTDEELACIAKSTGGEYFSAKNATALYSAMKSIVKKVEKVEPTPTPKPTPKKLKNNIEITVVEKEGGKWLEANHNIYKQDEEGKLGKRMTSSFWSSKKEAIEKKLPLGKYILTSSYNKFRNNTPFELKEGEVTKLNIIMGQTSRVALTVVEKEGGKWLEANHDIYKQDEDGKLGERMTSSFWSSKKEAVEKKLPLGKYILTSSYNKFRNNTPFELKEGEVTKLHIVFEQFRINTKCTDKNSEVNYEIYESNGRMVHEQKLVCSKPLRLSLDKGNYSVEAKVNNSTKEEKFTIGGDSSKLIIDMTTIKKEPTKEELIKADSQSIEPSKEKPKKEESKKEEPKENSTTQQSQMDIKKIEIKGVNPKDLEEAGKLLNALGGLFGAKTEPTKESKAQEEKSDKEFDKMSQELDMFTK